MHFNDFLNAFKIFEGKFEQFLPMLLTDGKNTFNDF